MRSKRKIQKREFKKFLAFKKVDCQKDLQVKHFSWLRAIQGPPMSGTHTQDSQWGEESSGPGVRRSAQTAR